MDDRRKCRPIRPFPMALKPMKRCIQDVVSRRLIRTSYLAINITVLSVANPYKIAVISGRCHRQIGRESPVGVGYLDF